MMTIYEKEALFDQLDEDFSQIKRFICDAVGQVELHDVEREVFRQLSGFGSPAIIQFCPIIWHRL